MHVFMIIVWQFRQIWKIRDRHTHTHTHSAENNTTALLGAIGPVVEYPTRNREVAGSTHTRSTASNLVQVANLLCTQANSASFPQRDWKWVVATASGWRPSVADWGDGMSASCTVGPVVREHGQWMAT